MDSNRFRRIAKVLADPRRFEIFEQMAASTDELACGRIVERFPVSQATISHHLKELTDAGLIEIRPQGQFRYCRARLDVLQDYIQELQSRCGLARKSKTSPKRRTRSTS
jgi:ArsR family transcriptional regulator, arsenate/arsenite/antimonite-responsive transcriptional repressor